MEQVMKTKLILTILTAAVFATTGVHGDEAAEREADHGDFLFTGESVELALIESRMHPRVKVSIAEDEYEFIVDTGAGVNVIDTQLAEAQGYEVVGETEIGAPGGPQIPATIVRVPLMQVGSATIIDAEFVTMDIAGFSGGQTQGVLGINLFREHLLTFDAGAGRITVSHGNLAAADPGVMPYVTDESSLVTIELNVAGTPVATHVDTGSMGSFMLSADMLESLPVDELPIAGGKARLVGGERDIKFAELQGSIEFAGLSYENPRITFMSPAPGQGNLGSEIMDELVVSIDQENQLISFQKPAGREQVKKAGKPRRLGLMFRGMQGQGALTVGNVFPGSIAEKAGLLAGDNLVSLNDRPAADYNMSDLRELFGSTTPLFMEVERGGQMKAVHIP
jgi:hypothetical protein